MTIYIYTYVDIHHQHQQFTWPFSPDSRLSGGRLRVAMPRVVSLHLRRHHERQGQWVNGWYQAEKHRKPWKPMESMFFIGNHKKLCRKPFIWCFSTWYPISRSPTLQMLLWTCFSCEETIKPLRNPCSCKPEFPLNQPIGIREHLQQTMNVVFPNTTKHGLSLMNM